MAKVDLRLSGRAQDNGKREILIRFYQGKQFNLRAKTGVFIDPDYFEYDIDWTKTVKAGVKMQLFQMRKNTVICCVKPVR